MLFSNWKPWVIFWIWASSSKVEGPSSALPWLGFVSMVVSWFPLKVGSVGDIYNYPIGNLYHLLIYQLYIANWVTICHRSHLFRGTRNNYWLYHCRLPCLFHHLGEYVFTFFGGGLLSYQQNRLIFCLPWWELWLFFYVPARPRAKTCWVKRFSLWFFPFTHPPPCWKYKNESHKITASKYLPNFH